ncbi:hypothetical protein MKW92_035491 [Papaver armeniacum]|nr:hypothetical protein MKW92_035491 [Papaver armeniacum]
MISAISWVPKGIAKAIPVEVEPPTKEEIDEILKSTSTLDTREDSDNEENEGMDVDAAKGAANHEISRALAAAQALGVKPRSRTSFGVDAAKGAGNHEISQALAAAEALGVKPRSSTSFSTKDMTDALKELNMDNYDEEDDGIEIFSTATGDRYYPSNQMDPYLKKDDDDEDEEEIEDMTIKASDAVIVCARTDDDVCVLEELEDGELNFYSHHDIILPAFPLCTAWLDFDLKRKGGGKGNFVAVGTMEPAIEIWDLDLIDEIQPCLVLGGVAKKKKKGKKKAGDENGSHTDSVLGLDWNKKFKCLASASADKSVKVWDLETQNCQTINHHTDKVQAVAWNPHEPKFLLSGSFDRSVVLVDVNNPLHICSKSVVTADVECLVWDPNDQYSCLVSLENGTVQGFDFRVASSDPTSMLKPSFTLQAHDKEVTSISFCPTAPKLLATGSTDKMVKLWDLSNNQPSWVASKNLNAEDCPFLLAVGGSKGDMQVWDTLTEDEVARRFGKHSNRKLPAPNEQRGCVQ